MPQTETKPLSGQPNIQAGTVVKFYGPPFIASAYIDNFGTLNLQSTDQLARSEGVLHAQRRLEVGFRWHFLGEPNRADRTVFAHHSLAFRIDDGGDFF